MFVAIGVDSAVVGTIEGLGGALGLGCWCWTKEESSDTCLVVVCTSVSGNSLGEKEWGREKGKHQ